MLLDPTGSNRGKRDIKTPPPADPTTLNYSNITSSTADHTDGTLHELDKNRCLKRDNDDQMDGQGMSSFIERVHNVTQREERPSKKQKRDAFDDDDQEKKAIHGGGGKGGEIGEYMRQKKKEGLAESGTMSTIVDLTGGWYIGSSACSLDINGHRR